MADTAYSRMMGVQHTEQSQQQPTLFGAGDDDMMFSKRRNPELVKADKLMKQYTPSEAIAMLEDMINTGRIHVSIAELEKILWIALKHQDGIMSNPDKAMVARFISRMNIIFYMGQALSWKTEAYNPIITAWDELRKNQIEQIYSRAVKLGAGQNENDKQYGVLNTSIMKHEIKQEQQPIQKEKGFLKKILGR